MRFSFIIILIFTTLSVQTPQMAFSKKHTHSIHYKITGNGPPLVLLFGFGMSLEEWFDFGYADQLKESFTIIAVEPRGHGKSMAPETPGEYSLIKLADDVISVLDELNIKQTAILGYSMGAKIALGVAKYHPERVNRLVVGGFEIHSMVNLSDDIVSKTLQSGPGAWRQLWESLMDLPEPMAERLEAINPLALHALRNAEAEWDSFKPLLQSLDIPVLFFAGENCFSYSDVKKADGWVQDSDFVGIPGEDHFSLMGALHPFIGSIQP